MPVELRSEATAQSFANPAHKKRDTRTLRRAIRTVLDQEYAEQGLKRGRREVFDDQDWQQALDAGSVTRGVENCDGRGWRKIRCIVL